MTLRRALVPLVAIPALVLSACGGPSGQKVEVGDVTVTIPEGWSEVTDESALQGGWGAAYADDPEDPTMQVRISSDLGYAPAADSTFSSLQAEAMFNGAFGEGFSIDKREDWSLRGADRALRASFSSTIDGDVELDGRWWLFSTPEVGTTAGVELSGPEFSDETAEAIEDSISYSPGR